LVLSSYRYQSEQQTLGEARIKVSPDCTSTLALVPTFWAEKYYSVKWRWTENI